ncbi:GNAT superfamily N-acetyltransferase [Actinoplanes lutulentus]|uniref:Acetyltransferase (GNAT) family protein n=1 Tax=Actinoplanes lutulentus TaxID=1287878 RepID=A0A327Z7N1_9ACTN|nr:GNAT family N-acetyltransferase [Actinoplanes lutulentus]MBB2948475.1 GNAT superfamily N-acetyltransferase [Actinoplanes lutulentus]RAK34493.1 acetyltransferase (GNAT) family protein [Actinoplanes lutulentus]
MELDVRECRDTDVARLEEVAPTGANRYHEARRRRHAAGLSTFLIAWSGGIPVGSGEILWEGPREPVVAALFPGCPEINGLLVLEPWRSRGIGTHLIHRAEERAATRGLRAIGLGVDDGNTRAAALYLRLGYVETGCHYDDHYPWIDEAGARHIAADPCRFLMKALA